MDWFMQGENAPKKEQEGRSPHPRPGGQANAVPGSVNRQYFQQKY